MNINELKKDVESFGKGVKRLEQLEVEFNKINTFGHEKEAEEMRHMLKNVYAIPELEVKIAKLKKSVYRRNWFKYKFKRAFPSVTEKQNRVIESKRSKENELERKYRLFLKCQNLSSRLEKVIQDKDKLRAKELYLESRDIYCKLGYLEKKKIYNQLMNSYNKLRKLYRER